MIRCLPLVLLALHFNAGAAQTDWIAQSNKHAEVLLDVTGRYLPEYATMLGIEGYDAEVLDLESQYAQRQEQDLEQAARQLEAARAQTTDLRVRQDLDILIDAARDQRRTSELNRRRMIPFFDLGQTVYSGFQNLIDERIPKRRQKAAVQRLKRYAGAEKGYQPITQLARARYEEAAANPELIGPWIVEAQQYLDNQQRFMDGIEELLRKSGLQGWEADMRMLRQQLDEYGEWVRSTVLPRARKSSQLPAEIYADNLKSFGVEMDPRELIERASASYVQTRSEMQTLSRLIAQERKLSSHDYRDVLRVLKKDRIPDEQLLATYRERLAAIESIVRREHLVTLPERDAVIRLATEAESAAIPAPHVDPPRLVGNTGEPAEFVLPMSNPNARPGAEMDDFTNHAISWTLTAHEARPGHELQFAAMLERGVSTARVVFAFNSANVEGWALYAEAQMKEHLPLEGQIGVLQMRMMREARAFLDPMINLGLIEPAQAQRFLMEEIILSEPMAKQEVDRYSFRAPGQATSYFYGYSKLNALRTKVEIALPERLDERAYHDFIIGQGLLPFDLLEKAVMEEFVGARGEE
ncbi:MAG TPA: DUF885 domain-containing protein [Steroidobacter sp.]|nr:DUF885 domain-containing protein [Steroidobacter sp.]